MQRLEGRVALVTGGARGIGRAIVDAFASEGARVAILSRSQDAADTAAAEIRAAGHEALAIAGNPADDEDARRAVAATREAFGTLDILVNNAGFSRRVPFLELTPADWDELMNVDLRAVFLMCRHAAPVLTANGGGRIINVASQIGQRGAPQLVHYAAAKAGVIGFTKALARELAPAITVNAIAPGPIWTEMIRGRDPDWYEAIERELPLGRIGLPEEVAPSAVFLASADGALYTGQTLGPNSGHVML
ncbi:MAG: 3-oxoacyl-ACP reductase family protein [Thermomicrobiales bacterium]